MFKTKDELLETIIDCLPYPQQITKLNITKANDAIYFTWRVDNHFKIELNGNVSEVDDTVLIVNDICIILRELLKRGKNGR